jgi:WD40 repeat protein/serine/threonine protein kinase
MSSGTPISAVDIQQAVKRFEDAWQRGEQPVIGDYCTPSDPCTGALLKALVLIDFEWRLKAGETRKAEDYLREFPALQSQKEAILELSQLEARWKVGEAPAGLADGAPKSSILDDADMKSSGAALETAASGADLSAIAPTRTSPGELLSAAVLSGETVSAVEPPSFSRLPIPRMLGKFQLLEVVGQGGFGTVFRGVDTELSRSVAVKVPKRELVGSEKERERFIREARSAAALRHPNIVPVYEVGGTHDRPYIVSAFVEGSTLSKVLAEKTFEPAEEVAIVRDLAGALHYAHCEGIIHRDVKPSNIMVDAQGQPYLMDFGLARREGEALITIAGQIVGTPAYMSPEQAEGRPVDARTDVYSLGVVLYELLTGERPFRGNVQSVLHQVINAEPRSPKLVNRTVSRDLEKICMTCLQKVPSDRYRSARELEEDLSRFLLGLPVRVRKISRLARTGRWARRHPKTAIPIALAVFFGSSLPIVWWINKAEIARANKQIEEEGETARRAKEANERLFISKGNEKSEAGNPMLALPWFAAALEQLPERVRFNSAHRVRLVTNMAGQRLENIWLARGPIKSVARCPGRPLLALAPSALQAIVLDLSIPPRAPVVLRHPNTLLQCVFSPDGKRLAMSCYDHGVRIWPTSDLTSDPLCLQHASEATWIGFNATGRLLAVATADGTVRLWDASNGSLRGQILRHPEMVNQFAFSLDGAFLATAGSDGAVRLWSVDTCDEVATRKHIGPVNCLGFAPAGKLIFSGSDDGILRAWDPRSRDQEFEFRVGSPVTCLAFSVDGAFVAAGCRDGRLGVWNIKTKAPVAADFRHQQSVVSLHFSRDSQTLVTGGHDDTVRIWDLKTGLAKTPPFVCAGGVVWAELTDDEQHLMAAGLDWILREWSLTNGLRKEHRCADVKALKTIQMSPGGRWLLLLDEQGSPTLCDLNTTELRAITLPNSTGSLHAAFTPDGNSLVLGDRKGDLSLWDLFQQPKFIRRQTGNGPLIDVCFSRDRQSLVTANTDGSARIFSLARRQFTLTLPHGLGLKRAFSSVDGNKIYTVGGSRGLCLWDAASGNVVAESSERADKIIEDCDLSRDGRLLLATWHQAPATICNPSTLEPIRTIIGSPISASFSDDGMRLVTTDQEPVARVFDVSDEELARPTPRKKMWPEDKAVPTTSPHRAPATCCAIRADGTLIATGSDDKTARVWDAETGEPVSPPLKHTDHVIFVGFREGGNQLVTVSADAVMRLWTLDDGTQTERLIHLAKATSGQQIENGSTVALKPRQIEAEWNAARGVTGSNAQ